MKIGTALNNVWYEVDELNRVFLCQTCGPRVRKVIVSKRATKKQAIKTASKLRDAFNLGVSYGDY